MTEEEVYESMYQYDLLEVNRNNKVLLRIKNLMGKYFLKDLEQYLYDCDVTHNFSITNKRPIERTKQMENDYDISRIKFAYIQQWAEGIEGDSWSGIVNIYLTRGMYFKFHYSM